MTGHNIIESEDFTTFDLCAKELEDFHINNFGDEVYAIYGMSMGVWQVIFGKIRELALPKKLRFRNIRRNR